MIKPIVRAVVALVLVVAAVAVAVWLLRPRVSEEEVQSLVVTTLQRESPASFLVTGTLDLVATTTVENTRYFLPGVLSLNLGTTRATVRIPGRVSYGVEVGGVKPEMIRLREDELVEVTLPPIGIYSVEPQLRQLEVETSRGWLRTDASTERVERRAIAHLETALRRQAASHLRGSMQPRINTARALESLLRPVLQAAGMRDPRFRFLIGEGVVMER